MLFNSALYGVFLLAAYAVFWTLSKRRLPRVLFLVAASYGFYFYGTWDSATEQQVPGGPFLWALLCLGIIFVGSTIDFAVGKKLGRTESKRARKALLLVSIVYYLGVLSLFKYWNFAVDSFAQLFAAAGLHVQPTHLRLVLPFGISFFTFETMSYTIDVYRKEIPPADRYLDYLLFVCFFPHLVAGPIVRPHTMLPQLAETPVMDANQQADGMWRIAQGLFKKVAIGDFLAQNLVNRVFDNPERYSSLEVAIAVYAYAIQIYCDFSGYTDVAIGSAQLFGYRLPPNFDRPYLSLDLQDFWRRWHISLSSWLRDYLYIPLGGSKHGTWKTYRNLFLTMLLGGLWHGAAWTFVIWGALHGGMLAVNRWVSQHQTLGTWKMPRPLSIFLTFQFVCFAWIFFRASSFELAMLVLKRIGKGELGVEHLTQNVFLVLALGFVLHLVPRSFIARAKEQWTRSPAFVQGAILAAFAYGLHRVAGAKAEPFVYGQF